MIESCVTYAFYLEHFSSRCITRKVFGLKRQNAESIIIMDKNF